MLVLQRKSGQALRGVTAAGETFRINFHCSGQGVIRVAIDAPKSIKFARDELPELCALAPTVADVKPEAA